ncbi:MAG TPA: energy transducer TonB [Polyangia bacterium]|nr:energy transducer TonB [Polyangia bacterium]
MRYGPVIITVVISAALHVALATGLVAVAQQRDVRRRAISVAVQDAKKKEAKPKPPAPPKPIAKPAAPKPAAPPPPSAAPVHVAHAAPVTTNLAMSNTGSGAGGLDIGPGIGLHGRADAPPPAAAKVASAISESRMKKAKEDSGNAEAACNEEPTKPEAIVKTEINYALHPQAQADGLEGKFQARLTIDENGEVSNVEVLAGIEPAFDAAIVASLKTWRFKPAMACGKPVGGATYVVKRTFELGD